MKSHPSNAAKDPGHSVQLRLAPVIDRLGLTFSCILTVVLSGLYVLGAYMMSLVAPAGDTSERPFTFEGTCWQFIRDVSAATVPVFILFVFSYWLLREINALKKQEETGALADEIAARLAAKAPSNTSADLFFGRRTQEGPLLNEAIEEILFVQETGSLLLEQWKSAISSLIRRGGRVRGVVVTPSGIGAKLLAFRNPNLRAEALQARAMQFIEHIHGVFRETPNSSSKLEVRFCTYPVCSTMVLVDPSEKSLLKGNALIRLAGFRQPFGEKLDFTLQRTTSPIAFNHYTEEFRQLWYASSKIILVTGQPHSGKTTLLERILEAFPKNVFTYWALSREETSEQEPTRRYVVSTSLHQNPRVFATKVLGEYRLESNVWDSIAKEIETVARDGALILLDEMGWMQFKSAKFMEVISNLLDMQTVSIIASIVLDDAAHPFARQMKRHYRSTVLHLEKENNESELERILTEEISGLVDRPSIM